MWEGGEQDPQTTCCGHSSTVKAVEACESPDGDCTRRMRVASESEWSGGEAEEAVEGARERDGEPGLLMTIWGGPPLSMEGASETAGLVDAVVVAVSGSSASRPTCRSGESGEGGVELRSRRG